MHGIKQNHVEAARWITKASEQGDADAQTTIGRAYYEGKGVLRDYVTAYMWLSRPTAQGNKSAKEELDSLEHNMSTGQVAEAQRLVR